MVSMTVPQSVSFLCCQFYGGFLIALFKLNIFVCVYKSQDNLLFLLFVCLFSLYMGVSLCTVYVGVLLCTVYVGVSLCTVCMQCPGRPEARRGVYPLELGLHTY